MLKTIKTCAALYGLLFSLPVVAAEVHWLSDRRTLQISYSQGLSVYYQFDRQKKLVNKTYQGLGKEWDGKPIPLDTADLKLQAILNYAVLLHLEQQVPAFPDYREEIAKFFSERGKELPVPPPGKPSQAQIDHQELLTSLATAVHYENARWQEALSPTPLLSPQQKKIILQRQQKKWPGAASPADAEYPILARMFTAEDRLLAKLAKAGADPLSVLGEEIDHTVADSRLQASRMFDRNFTPPDGPARQLIKQMIERLSTCGNKMVAARLSDLLNRQALIMVSDDSQEELARTNSSYRGQLPVFISLRRQFLAGIDPAELFLQISRTGDGATFNGPLALGRVNPEHFVLAHELGHWLSQNGPAATAKSKTFWDRFVKQAEIYHRLESLVIGTFKPEAPPEYRNLLPSWLYPEMKKSGLRHFLLRDRQGNILIARLAELNRVQAPGMPRYLDEVMANGFALDSLAGCFQPGP